MCVIGLGAFEYFQLAEELSAEPVWVINNGISHTYSVPADQIWPLVQVTPAHTDPTQLSHSPVLPVYGKHKHVKLQSNSRNIGSRKKLLLCSLTCLCLPYKGRKQLE